MSDGVYTLSTSLLESLLEREQRDNARCETHASRGKLPEFSDDPNSVTSHCRDREIRWMCAMGRSLGLDLNTISVAITVFDRVLDTVNVQIKYVNCVALASLYLAAKLHEECIAIPYHHGESSSGELAANSLSSPSSIKYDMPLKLFCCADTIFENGFEEFYYNLTTKNEKTVDENMIESGYWDASDFLARLRVDYSPRELTRMESQILSLLDWDLLARPTCAQFLEAMLAVAGAPHLAASPTLRTNFEAIVAQWKLAGAFSASTLALALLSVMFETSFGLTLAECVTSALADVFKIEKVQLAECRAKICQVLRQFYAQAQFLSERAATRSLSTSPFSSVSTARASPLPMTDEERICDKEEKDIEAEIANVLYRILEKTQQ